MNYLFEAFYVFINTPWGMWGMIISGVLIVLLIVARIAVWHFLFSPILKKFESAFSDTHKPLLEIKKLYYLWFIVLAALVGYWFWQLAGAIIGALIGASLMPLFFSHQRKEKQNKVEHQLPLFLRALGSTLKAGYSVPQALVFVALEVEDPLRNKLKTGVRMLEWQQPLEVVLKDWKTAVSVPEFSFLTRSLLLQSKTGGNLVDLCHRVAYLLEERQKLERDIKSFTAQGKMSGLLMAALWPISLLLFAW